MSLATELQAVEAHVRAFREALGEARREPEEQPEWQESESDPANGLGAGLLIVAVTLLVLLVWGALAFWGRT